MAINLASASSGRVDFGDLSGLAAQTALSFAIILKPTATFFTNDRIFTQWGSVAGDRNVLCNIQDSVEIGFVATDGAGGFFGRKTTDVSMAVGTEYRVLCTIAFGSPPVIHIYVNGVDRTLAVFIGSADIAQSIDSTSALQVGFETAESNQNPDGDYAEFAVWQRELNSTEASAFTPGNQYPTCLGSTGLIYLPMNDTTDLTDRWSSVTAALTDGSNATHPTMVNCGGPFGFQINNLRPSAFRPGIAR